MLKTECPACKKWVSSPLLNELKETTCPECGLLFAVNDLYVSSGPFSIYRKSLLKKEQKYTRFLKDTKNKLTKYKQTGDGIKVDSESVATLDKFVSGLEELLAGCRDRLRVSVKDENVMYSTDSLPQHGRLVNMSTSGVCIEASNETDRLQSGSFVILIINDTDYTDMIYLHGEVVWAADKGRIGIRFVNREPETDKRIKVYMLQKSCSG